MSSTGNDIVALGKIDKDRTGQFRFYSKILSVSEQAIFHQLRSAEMPFEHFVWLLWSVKEAAYKYLKRSIPDLIFSPTKTVIQQVMIPAGEGIKKRKNIDWDHNGMDEALYRGQVVYGTCILYFRAKYNEDWIATVVNDDADFDNVCWGTRFIKDCSYEQQSGSARALLLNKLKTYLPDDYRVDKSPVGYPVIMNATLNMNIPVSLAHDDHFVAYSFKLYAADNN